jgi:hypothetical protein
MTKCLFSPFSHIRDMVGVLSATVCSGMSIAITLGLRGSAISALLSAGSLLLQAAPSTLKQIA